MEPTRSCLATRRRDGVQYGRVYDRLERRLFPEMLLDSIVARGYWEPYRGSAAERSAVEAEARAIASDDRG